MSPNFGESALLTAGDEIKNVDFFSATRSNNDLKDMLESQGGGAEKPHFTEQHELYKFAERQGKGNELRISSQ